MRENVIQVVMTPAKSKFYLVPRFRRENTASSMQIPEYVELGDVRDALNNLNWVCVA